MFRFRLNTSFVFTLFLSFWSFSNNTTALRYLLSRSPRGADAAAAGTGPTTPAAPERTIHEILNPDGFLRDGKFTLTMQEISEMGVTDIYCCGDVHANLGAWWEDLYLSELTDPIGRWKKRNALLLMFGDLPDRGDETFQTLQYAQQLHQSVNLPPNRFNSAVIWIMGNHEMKYINGFFGAVVKMAPDLTVHPQDEDTFSWATKISDFQYATEQQKMFMQKISADAQLHDWMLRAANPHSLNEFRSKFRTPDGDFLSADAVNHSFEMSTEDGRFIRNFILAIQLGDWTCVHAGFCKSFIEENVDLDFNEMNKAFRDQNTKKEDSALGRALTLQRGNNPVWTREFLVNQHDRDAEVKNLVAAQQADIHGNFFQIKGYLGQVTAHNRDAGVNSKQYGQSQPRGDAGRVEINRGVEMLEMGDGAYVVKLDVDRWRRMEYHWQVQERKAWGEMKTMLHMNVQEQLSPGDDDELHGEDPKHFDAADAATATVAVQ